jgi:hypothetical protein
MLDENGQVGLRFACKAALETVLVLSSRQLSLVASKGCKGSSSLDFGDFELVHATRPKFSHLYCLMNKTEPWAC